MVISAWAPLMNPPISEAFFGMPAAFITSSTCGPKTQQQAGSERRDGERTYSARDATKATGEQHGIRPSGRLGARYSGPRSQRYSLVVKKPRPGAASSQANQRPISRLAVSVDLKRSQPCRVGASFHARTRSPAAAPIRPDPGEPRTSKRSPRSGAGTAMSERLQKAGTRGRGERTGTRLEVSRLATKQQ
jgi:hypothetical protein